MKYYIIATTFPGRPAPTLVTQDSVDKIIAYMKTMVQRKLNMNYEQYTTHIADLGHHGGDERSFYNSLTDTFNSGVVRGEKLLRCNIYEANSTEGSD